jgi:quercetin dioxygenase-like cupin family protein
MVDSKEMPWEDAPEGFYFTDVKQKTLWVNEETGATMVLMKFPVGLADDVHSHPEANQFMFGLKGEVELPSGVRRSIEGDFLYNTKRA